MKWSDQFRQAVANAAAPAPAPATPVYPRQPSPPVPPPAERFAVPLFCSREGKYSVILAEKHGSQMKFVDCEKLPDGLALPSPNQDPFARSGGGANLPPAARLGAFTVNSAGWCGCAWCGVNGSLKHGIGPTWWCDCAKCAGLFHCAGSNERGLFRRACGGFTTLEDAVGHDTVPVHGWQGFDNAPPPGTLRQPPPVWEQAPRQSLALPPGRQIAAPRDRQLPAPPSASLRIGFRGRP